jgi:hypothetical protein
MFATQSTIFAAIVFAFTYAAFVEQITVFEDHVEWTTAMGRSGFCPMSELTVTRKVAPKGGVYYNVGPQGGPYFALNSDIADHQNLVDDLIQRTGGNPTSMV